LTTDEVKCKIFIKYSCSIHNEMRSVHIEKQNEEGGIMGKEKKEKKRGSIVKRMIIAVVAGFIVGFLCLLLRECLNGNGNENVWNIVDAIFFQDITTTTGFEGLGILYIVGQLFM